MQVFWDSDVGKWIEAASYALSHRRDADIEAKIEDDHRRSRNGAGAGRLPQLLVPAARAGTTAGPICATTTSSYNLGHLLGIGHEKGSTTESRLKHNFGMARPEGYRKAVRLMEMADRFGIPVLALVDTAGAYPGIGAEERGQAEAIARSTEACLELGVPNVAVIIGEGGSGGAIAIATANRVLMLEHAIYSVISPEGAASILWRDTAKAQEAATSMKITAERPARASASSTQIVTEPVGGAHRDPAAAIAATGEAIANALDELKGLDRDTIAPAAARQVLRDRPQPRAGSLPNRRGRLGDDVVSDLVPPSPFDCPGVMPAGRDGRRQFDRRTPRRGASPHPNRSIRIVAAGGGVGVRYFAARHPASGLSQHLARSGRDRKPARAPAAIAAARTPSMNSPATTAIPSRSAAPATGPSASVGSRTLRVGDPRKDLTPAVRAH